MVSIEGNDLQSGIRQVVLMGGPLGQFRDACIAYARPDIDEQGAFASGEVGLGFSVTPDDLQLRKGKPGRDYGACGSGGGQGFLLQSLESYPRFWWVEGKRLTAALLDKVKFPCLQVGKAFRWASGPLDDQLGNCCCPADAEVNPVT